MSHKKGYASKYTSSCVSHTPRFGMTSKVAAQVTLRLPNDPTPDNVRDAITVLLRATIDVAAKMGVETIDLARSVRTIAMETQDPIRSGDIVYIRNAEGCLPFAEVLSVTGSIAVLAAPRIGRHEDQPFIEFERPTEGLDKEESLTGRTGLLEIYASKGMLSASLLRGCEDEEAARICLLIRPYDRLAKVLEELNVAERVHTIALISGQLTRHDRFEVSRWITALRNGFTADTTSTDPLARISSGQNDYLQILKDLRMIEDRDDACLEAATSIKGQLDRFSAAERSILEACLIFLTKPTAQRVQALRFLCK